MTAEVHHGDSRDVLATMAENSIDLLCSDPPYDIESILKRFGKPDAAKAKDGALKSMSDRFHGEDWDTGETAFDPEFWSLCKRVMKPGAYAWAFSHETKYDLLVGAMRKAGFQIIGMGGWLYASGVPATKDVALLVDKAHGAGNKPESAEAYKARTPEGKAWEGYHTRLKPALEPICLAMKPREGTIAANAEKWGTGAMNIGGSMIEHPDGMPRYPANIFHDGSEVVRAALGDASAVFYEAKADAADRFESEHPTVKPVNLMRRLCRLGARPGARVLDPFAGTGTTGIGALREGMRPVLIEREAKYIADIHRRLKAMDGSDTPLFGGGL